MKKVAVLAALIAAGCQTAPVEDAPQRPLTQCERLISLLKSQYLGDWQKAAAFEAARNHGCFGAPR